MAKKRKGKSKTDAEEGAKKPPKMKDPNPNSREYMYDKIDTFHMDKDKDKDKILLDPNAKEDGEDEELEEDFDEEVLPLEGSSDDEDEEDEDEDEEEEGEDEEDEDGDMFEESDDGDAVNDKAWGKNKKTFYNTDVQDDDIYASDEEAELAAEEEEKEAMVLQKRLAEKLDTEDFYAFDDVEVEEEEDSKVKKVKVAKDLSTLSKRERLEILAEESPELLPLLDEYKDKWEDLRERYHPLVLLVRNGLITNAAGAQFIEMKHQLLLNYLVNVSFYLALKSTKGERTKGHPVINVLVQHQQIFTQMKPFEEKLEPEITEFLLKYKDDIENGTLVNMNADTALVSETDGKLKSEDAEDSEETNNLAKVKPLNATMDPLEYYNMIKAKTEGAKKAKKMKLDESADVEAENEEETTEEGGKRMITYEMSKNKGLIRNRRKELKNPRVKHKVKFKKAVVKRKGVVREVQREVNRYGGESTGITASLSRSTKIK